MSEVKVNKISPRTNCGTTTLGDSGDSFVIPSGVTITNNGTQTGFGRTGAVDWQTTKKTGDFTAVNGEGYFVDTGSGAITATLPASPSAGNIVYIKDYDGNFGTNNCTVARNGSNIRGATNNIDLGKNNAGAVFIYVDATEGWQVFFDGADTDATASFITATGGTVTTSGNCKIHTFTGPGTFTVSSLSDCSANNIVSYMVVAGGGSGGNAKDGTNGNAAGAGAGGYREAKSPSTPYTASPLNGSGTPGNVVTVTAAAFPITVGAGAAAKTTCSAGATGSNSIFSTITSAGGGGGGGGPGTGLSGGSGGGAANSGSIGSGNTPPTTPPQGNNGGSQHDPGTPNTTAGGGGGAGAVGANGNPGGPAGNGGVGVASSINGTPTTRAGGGGGGGNSGQTGGGSGGSGGGGAGGTYGGPACGVNGTANTGGGGGATASNCTSPATSGAGGSGIVVIRYKFQ